MLCGQVVLSGEDHLRDPGLVGELCDELLERPAEQVFGLAAAGRETVSNDAPEGADCVRDGAHWTRIFLEPEDAPRALFGTARGQIGPKWTPSTSGDPPPSTEKARKHEPFY